MTRLRVFEYFVAALVFGVMICFCIQLSYLRNTSAGDVFRGYLPSSAIVKGSGIYQSCGIIGATVMPHSLFLGSGIVQPRIRQFDDQRANEQPSLSPTVGESSSTERYHPAPHVIRTCIKYSIVELTTSLFTIALFVNSAILIVAGSSSTTTTTRTPHPTCSAFTTCYRIISLRQPVPSSPLPYYCLEHRQASCAPWQDRWSARGC